MRGKCEEWVTDQELSRTSSYVPSTNPRSYAKTLDSRRNRDPALEENYKLAGLSAQPEVTPRNRFYGAGETAALESLNRQAAQFNIDMPAGPNEPLKLPVTPLAHRAYPKLDQSHVYGALPGSFKQPQPQPGRYVSSPSFGPGPASSRAGSAHRDTTSSGSYYSSLHPSASASNANYRSQSLALQPYAPPAPTPLTTSTFIRDLHPEAGVVLTPADANWNAEIFKIFTMVLGWVKLHCRVVDPRITAQLPMKASRLWNYVVHVTYPERRGHATNHANFMLNDETLRPYFITRLMVQYITQQMWEPKAWEGLDETLTQTLQFVNHKLEGTPGFGKSTYFFPPPPGALFFRGRDKG